MHNNFGTNNRFIKYAIIASILVHGLGFAAYSVISQNSKRITYDAAPLQQSISLNFTKSNNTAKKQPQEKEDVVKEELLEEVSVVPAEPTQEPEPIPEPIEPVIEVKEIPQTTPQPAPTKEPVKKPVKPKDFTPKPVPKKTEPKKIVEKQIVEKKRKPKKTITPKKIVKKTVIKPAKDSKENQDKSSQSLSDNTITKNAVFKGSRKIPKYPRRAQMKGLEGTVILVALIDIDGKIKKLQDIKVLKSSGYKELDKAAKKAMWKDRFKPEYQNGKPVQYWGKAPYQFVLR